MGREQCGLCSSRSSGVQRFTSPYRPMRISAELRAVGAFFLWDATTRSATALRLGQVPTCQDTQADRHPPRPCDGLRQLVAPRKLARGWRCNAEHVGRPQGGEILLPSLGVQSLLEGGSDAAQE